MLLLLKVVVLLLCTWGFLTPTIVDVDPFVVNVVDW
jgi:hypothetical protein